jgi:2-phosphosulfolactate phosphatase
LFISVKRLPRDVPSDENFTAVVVDVLRATTVMATAFENGAKQIVTCVEVDEAKRLADGVPGRTLLCGERFCNPIPGFDLGNSPGDYGPLKVSGATLVMTTTNGTRALDSARHAKTVYAGAFVNLSALIEQLRDESNVCVICAGTDGHETEEDILFAGALVAQLANLWAPVTLDRSAEACAAEWEAFRREGESLADRLCRSLGGRNLVNAGYAEDVRQCATIDAVGAVPVMTDRTPITLGKAPSRPRSTVSGACC